MRLSLKQYSITIVMASVREELRAVVASTGHCFVTLPSRLVARRGHSSSFLLIRVALAIVVAGLWCHDFAMAGEEKPTLVPKLTFQIPEQPLVTALQAYSEESGVHVLYESGVEVGQLSVTIDGEFTRESALKALLGNSNLVIRYARADSVVLVNPAVAMADEPPEEVVLGGSDLALETLHVASPQAIVPDRAALNDYIGVLQQDVQQALRKGGKRSSGNYRVGLDLWVDPSRTVRKTEVFRSTGDRERDVAISEVLQGLVIRQDPPARTQQPVRVMIVVKSL
jgi:hypothetical protein